MGRFVRMEGKSSTSTHTLVARRQQKVNASHTAQTLYIHTHRAQSTLQQRATHNKYMFCMFPRNNRAIYLANFRACSRSRSQ